MLDDINYDDFKEVVRELQSITEEEWNEVCDTCGISEVHAKTMWESYKRSFLWFLFTIEPQTIGECLLEVVKAKIEYKRDE